MKTKGRALTTLATTDLARIRGGTTATYTTAFQNFDQKADQIYDMLDSVLKTIGEMQGIGAGSRSGL